MEFRCCDSFVLFVCRCQEYNVDEIATRHSEIRKVEKDLGEVAEMFRDLQQLVDEQQVNIDVSATHAHSRYRERGAAAVGSATPGRSAQSARASAAL